MVLVNKKEKLSDSLFNTVLKKGSLRNSTHQIYDCSLRLSICEICRTKFVFRSLSGVEIKCSISLQASSKEQAFSLWYKAI